MKFLKQLLKTITLFIHQLFKTKKMITTAFSTKNVTTSANDSSIGTVDWVNPSNVIAEDNIFATAVLGNNQVSHYLKMTGFGFSLPSDAIITGIKIRLKRNVLTGNNRIKTNAIQLVVGGVIQSYDFKGIGTDANGLWQGSLINVTYGGNGNLLGAPLSLVYSDVNAADFGFAISAINTTSISTTARIDYAEITLYYLTGGVATEWKWPGTLTNDDTPDNLDYLVELNGGGNAIDWVGDQFTAVNANDYSKYRIASNFNFNIPAGATPWGVAFIFKKNNSTTIWDYSVMPFNGTTRIGSDNAGVSSSGGFWLPAPDYYLVDKENSVGAQIDNLDEALVNSSDFGVGIAGLAESGGAIGVLIQVYARVIYTV